MKCNLCQLKVLRGPRNRSVTLVGLPVVHGIAWQCRVVQGGAGWCRVVQGGAWQCRVVHGVRAICLLHQQPQSCPKACDPLYSSKYQCAGSGSVFRSFIINFFPTRKANTKQASFALLGLCASWPDEASPEHDEQAAQLHCDHRAASHRSQQDGGAVQRDRE